MSYNTAILNRIKNILNQLNVDYSEKAMFSGVCIMVDDKMCCGTHIDKKTGEDYLLCRIGETACEEALKDEFVIPMEFTGKAMKGYVFVTGGGLATDKQLTHWLKLCLAYNPLAKSSKKKK